MHRLDARSKILLLLAYSVCLFFVDTWWGMAAMALLFAVALVASRIPAGKVFALVVPIYFIAAFTVVFNSFLFVDGAFTFQASGLVRGCFFAARIMLLVWASLVVCFTSTSTQLTDAVSAFLRPLRRLHVPTDDVAMVFSVALRFIPLMAEEFLSIRNAQWSRGAAFDSGPVGARLKAHTAILIPLFVGMFRKADNVARAMDARCYGLPGVQRTSLAARRMDAASIAALAVGCAAFVAVAVCL